MKKSLSIALLCMTLGVKGEEISRKYIRKIYYYDLKYDLNYEYITLNSNKDNNFPRETKQKIARRALNTWRDYYTLQNDNNNDPKKTHSEESIAIIRIMGNMGLDPLNFTPQQIRELFGIKAPGSDAQKTFLPLQAR